MAIRLATQTKELILSSVYKDQGRSYRRALKECMAEVDDAFRDEDEDKFRSHFGISTSGRECARELWYNWRWIHHKPISGHMLLLFNRGHLEEARFGALFKCAGLTIYQVDDEGKQYRVSHFGGHYGSAIDGVIVGIPEMPDEPVLGEMKTHNEKSFTKLAGDKVSGTNEREGGEGVEKSKPEHFAQIQQYMGYYKLRWTLYCAVNKNTDELYFELIEYQSECDEYFHNRSRRIIFMQSAPPRLSENSAFWKCKFCDRKPVCHEKKPPEENCRSCINAFPQEDGTWFCKEKSIILTKEMQLKGCADWASII